MPCYCWLRLTFGQATASRQSNRSRVCCERIRNKGARHCFWLRLMGCWTVRTMPSAVLQEQASRAPKDPQPYAALGLTYRQAKKYDEARQEFEKAAQLDPNNVALVAQLVELDLQQKRFDAARQRIRSHFQGKADSADAHFWEAKSAGRRRQMGWRRSRTSANAQARSQSFRAPMTCLVQAYIATNKLPQAIKELKSCWRRNQKFVGADDAGAGIRADEGLPKGAGCV